METFSKTQVVRAKFKPRFPDKWDNKTIDSCVNDKTYQFRYAYTLNNGDIYWEPDDLRFPSSNPVNQKDLIIDENTIQ